MVSEAWHYTLSEQGTLSVMTFKLANPRMEITHHSYDAFISACTRTMQDCFPGENYRFAEVWFAHPDFGLRDKYEQLLGCPCKFNTTSYAICLASRVLDLPLASLESANIFAENKTPNHKEIDERYQNGGRSNIFCPSGQFMKI